ncbi:MAG: hypothetical protein ABIJ48_07365 [Actinomycetota bacterium]
MQGEVDGAFLYRRLAEVADRHGAVWRSRLKGLGEASDPAPSRRGRFPARPLAGRFGPGMLVQVIAGEERRSRTTYNAQPEAAGTALPAEERSHARLLTALKGSGGVAGARIARLEGRHRAVGGNDLRAAVLGANDGWSPT